MKKFVFLFCMLFIIACSKKENFIVQGPVNPWGTNPPDTFSVTIAEIKDVEALVYWTKAVDQDKDSVSYEIAVGDSVIAYDLTQKNNRYLLKNLIPDKDYTVTVFALDPRRNARMVSKSFRTMKAFIGSVFSYNLGYDEYSFTHGIKTNDGGFLISGFGDKFNKAGTTVYFLLKLGKDLSIEWLREYPGLFSSVHQCLDNTYITTSFNSLSKMDAGGNVIWNYSFPDQDKVYLEGSNDDPEANVFVFGHSSRNPGSAQVIDEYFIAKFIPGGDLAWKKFGGTAVVNYPGSMIILSDGNLVLFGRAESTGSNAGNVDNWEITNWLLNTDAGGNFTGQHFYPNDLQKRSDSPYSFFLLPGDGYMMFGTTFGMMNGYGDAMPRFMKINPDFTVQWDKQYYLNSGGYYPSLTDYDIMGNGSYLILSTDDEGLNIAVLSIEGELDRQVKLNGFPVGLLIKYEQDEKIVLIDKAGDAFNINMDGYTDNGTRSKAKVIGIKPATIHQRSSRNKS